ncbi:MAG: hypothetical protein LC122_12555 [Chitinophagales bacterium]|nr:hypothetical protein [Chitinophagales bacterium]
MPFNYFNNIFDTFSIFNAFDAFDNIDSLKYSYEDKDGKLFLNVEVPGIDPQRIKVEYVGNLLLIEADNKKLELTCIYNMSMMTAEVRNGMLYLIIPTQRQNAGKVKVDIK